MKTIIFECEFFAVFCAIWSWREKLTGCNIVIHIDNDGVRDSFISCHTTNDNAVPILNAFLQLEFEAAMNTWITRVPAESNVADNPSRFDVTSLIHCAKVSFNSCSMWRTMSDRNWGSTATWFANPMLSKVCICSCCFFCEGHLTQDWSSLLLGWIAKFGQTKPSSCVTFP